LSPTETAPPPPPSEPAPSKPRSGRPVVRAGRPLLPGIGIRNGNSNGNSNGNGNGVGNAVAGRDGRQGLHAETDEPLIADQIIEIPLNVDQTAANTARRTWSGVKELAAVLGAFGVTVVGVIGAVVGRVRKRRRAKAAATDVSSASQST
jgi:hypothetical protein